MAQPGAQGLLFAEAMGNGRSRQSMSEARKRGVKTCDDHIGRVNYRIRCSYCIHFYYQALRY
jgi:hypothetical protein